MKTIGLDVGSHVTKIVILGDREVIYKGDLASTGGSEAAAKKAIQTALVACNLKRRDIDFITATGLRRRRLPFVDEEKSSMICLWRGATELLPGVKTIIEIGAENSIAIGVDGKGRIRDFANNDKCAAGSGLFVEMLAKLMGVSIEEMTSEALAADKEVAFNNQCALFVEQEVISYLSEPSPPSRREIFAGLFSALSSRIVGLARKVGIAPPIFLCGGLGKSEALVKGVEEVLKMRLYVPPDPQFVPALGAALFGMNAVMVHLFDPQPGH